MKLADIFCSRRKNMKQVYCRRCSKLCEEGAGACGHEEVQQLGPYFDDANLSIVCRLAKENAFQVFDILSSSNFPLLQLEQFNLTFVGTAHSWIIYNPRPWQRDFRGWRGINKNMPNLKVLKICLSEARISECIEQMFIGFEDLGKSQLEELELDMFSVGISSEQLLVIINKISKIKTLKTLSINIGKVSRLHINEHIIASFQCLFASLTLLSSLNLNLSSLTGITEPNGLLLRLFDSMSQLQNLTSLKLSLKNSRLSPNSLEVLKGFLEKVSGKLTELILDISYNPTLGANMTNSLCDSLGQFKELKSLTLNLKGSDSNFTKQDYLNLMQIVSSILQLSSQRIKSTQDILNSKMKEVQIYLPLSFVRDNLQLYHYNKFLLSLMLKSGPQLHSRLINSPYGKVLRKDILTEIFCEFVS